MFHSEHGRAEKTTYRNITGRLARGLNDDVGVAVGVSVTIGVGVAVGVSVGASVGVPVGVSVGTSVGVPVGVSVAVSVGVDVGVIQPSGTVLLS